MLELHNVTIGQQIRSLSLTVGSGQLMTLWGAKGSGKTTLLRAILGLIPIDGGHISIDGELLTMKSASYFRRMMAYVPQTLEVPEDYQLDTDYVALLRKAVETGKGLIVVDEPNRELDEEEQQTVDQLLAAASAQGSTVLAVNPRMANNQIRL